jgi:phospholipid transport system transporter-binding protein
VSGAADPGAAAAVALPARLTLPHVGAALAQVEAAVARGGALHLDASGVQDLDSSAVALVLQARRLALAAGLPFRLSAPPAKLLALASLYGVEPLLAA